MRLSESTRWVFPIALAFFSVQALAADFDNEFDEKPWAELEIQLPGFPEQENLISFQVGAVSDAKYMVDGNSLSVGPDGVVRYTLVVISPSGAQNISYEGLRCATGERRLYAFGRPDNTWSKARGNQWVRVHGSSNNHHVELYSNYFCVSGSGAVTNADEARRELRRGGQPAALR
jgi:hypothetical protein